MDYTSMMQGVPQMGMPYNMMQRPSDMSRPRHSYSYPYNSDPVFLMPQIPPPHHHRTMADHQSMVHAKQTEPKPRLAKDEVLLLETEFLKNPKPSSQRKREIAELLKVDNPRINNWFQNRRAKAKQMMRREADPRAAGDESPSESSPSEHQEDSLVSEYYGSNQQSLPLRASSATFPSAAMDQQQQHQHQQPSLTIFANGNTDGSLSHSTSPGGSADEYPSPANSHHHHEMAYAMSGYLASSAHAHHGQPASSHHHTTYEQSLDSYVPFTAAAAASATTPTSSSMGIESMEPMMAQVGSFQAELLSIDDVPQLDRDLIVMPSCEVTQLDPNNRQVSPAGSAASPPASAAVSPASDLRLKSPPPPANLASRRNKGAPSLLNAAAFRGGAFGPKTGFSVAGASRIQKHAHAHAHAHTVSASAAPRSPLFFERNKEALLHSFQSQQSRHSQVDVSPITPSSALALAPPVMLAGSSSDDDHLLAFESPESSYHSLPMQANPTSWTSYTTATDESLLTPGLASYGSGSGSGSDDFSSLMHTATAPDYIMSSQPPTPSVSQPLGHGYFPLHMPSAAAGGPGQGQSADYMFPGEGYSMMPGSLSVKMSPSQSKSKQFQFTQNVTPQDYSC